jgi:hypothetical protein
MTSQKIDNYKQNRDRGLYISRSRRVVVGTSWLEQSSFIQTLTAGIVVWKNSDTNEVGVASGEAGQFLPICADIILASATIDGVLETTTSTAMIWYATADNLGTQQ